MSEPQPRRGVRLALILSFFLNLVLITALALVVFLPSSSSLSLTETPYSGDATSPDKVAIIRVSGILLDGTLGFPRHQIEQAARDSAVKAIVLRIDSPGGTISASEDLYQELIRLRDNSNPRYVGSGPKPIIASMGSIAASGGYYIAMPAGTVLAEPTTITGSIGVFAALPNVSGLAQTHGVKVELIKAGAIKGGGSPLQELSPDERQPWQDVVDHAYDRFLTVVSTGRPSLTREKLVQDKIERMINQYTSKGDPILGPDGKPVQLKHTRYRADGGTFTPPHAKELGLIDEIADLSRAIHLAAERVGLTRFRVVTYVRSKGLAEQLLGFEIHQPEAPLSNQQLSASLTPQLWFLTPGYELAGTLTSTSSR